MKKLILKMYENDVIRYIFWGGCTTLVNLVSFYLMRIAGLPLMAANIIINYTGNPVCVCCKFQICISRFV